MSTATVIPERLEKLASLTLESGAHESVDAGMCVMEAAAWIAGEEHSDHPKCVCDVIGAAMRKANDQMPMDLRNELLTPLIPKLIGTKANLPTRKARAFSAADFACRVFAPMAPRSVSDCRQGNGGSRSTIGPRRPRRRRRRRLRRLRPASDLA